MLLEIIKKIYITEITMKNSYEEQDRHKWQTNFLCY